MDGNFNSTVENTTGKPLIPAAFRRTAYLYVRGKDAAGNWGAVSALFLTLTTPINNPPVANDQEVATLGE